MSKCLALIVALVAIITAEAEGQNQQEQLQQQAAAQQAAAQQAAVQQAAAQQAAQQAAAQQAAQEGTQQLAAQQAAQQATQQAASKLQQQMNAQQQGQEPQVVKTDTNEQIVINRGGADGYVNMIRNKAHIQDRDHVRLHLDGVIEKNEEEMTETELQLHYFKMHDYDNNLKLDGLEMMKAMSHFHHDGSKDAIPLNDEELMGLIDPILLEDDKNNDGYVDYPEFAAIQAS